MSSLVQPSQKHAEVETELRKLVSELADLSKSSGVFLNNLVLDSDLRAKTGLPVKSIAEQTKLFWVFSSGLCHSVTKENRENLAVNPV